MSSTKVIPIYTQELEFLSIQVFSGIELPLVASYVSAGFPSPADDYIEDKIDLGKFLVKNPTSTYFMRVRGNAMEDAKIHDGDVLVIDKSLKPDDGVPVVCFFDGAFTIMTFKKNSDGVFLLSANPAHAPMELTEDMDIRVWGVVVWILHKPVKL